MGTYASLIYVGTIIWLRWPFSIHTLRNMPINELGDTLAGFAGPLALFWLVMGYIQQGEELQQNTHAIRLQSEELSQNGEALRLQAEELRNAVEQHKEMVKATRDSVEFTKETHAAREAREKERSAPMFHPLSPEFEPLAAMGHIGPYKVLLAFKLANGSVLKVEVDDENFPNGSKFHLPPAGMEMNDTFVVVWEQDDNVFPHWLKIRLVYTAVDGRQYKQEIELRGGDPNRGMKVLTNERLQVA